MKEGTSVEAHLKNMKELTDKLAAISAPISEKDEVVILLGSLPQSYSTLVTALEARVDELSLSYVQQALLHEEQKKNRDKLPVSEGESGVGDSNQHWLESRERSLDAMAVVRQDIFVETAPKERSPTSQGN